MIQRIQSFWLFLACVCACLTFRLPFYVGTKLPATQLVELTAGSSLLLSIITVIIAIVALFSIFLFKKRPTQLRICLAGLILEALLIFLYYREVKIFTSGSYTLWSIIQGGILVFFIMAARGIASDEKLVKQSDRLR